MAENQSRGVEWGRRVLVCADDAMFARLSPTLGRLNMDVLRLDWNDVDNAERVLRQEPEVALMVVDDAEDAAARLERMLHHAPQMQPVLFVERERQEAFLRDFSQLVIPLDAPEALWVGAMRQAIATYLLVDENRRLRDVARTQARDLTELRQDVRVAIRRRQREVCDTKAAWERTFDAIRFPLSIVDTRANVRAANRAYATATDIPIQSIRGTTCHEAMFSRSTPCPGCPLATGADTHSEHSFDVEHQGKQSAYRVSCYPIIPDENVDDDASVPEGEPISAIDEDGSQLWVCTYRDLRDERAAAERDLQVQRNAAVGKLAAGVAHELNNPLGGILALSQVLLRDGPDDEETRETLEDIEDAAQRCRRITRALLMFARGPQGEQKEEIDVQNVIDASILVCRGELKAAMALEEVTVEAGLPPLFGWPSLLQEALVALLRNAATALEKSDVTRKVVSVRALRQGDTLWIEVADNGPGIGDDEREALGTPFATSEEKAQGAGLGLASVYRIMEKFGGHAEIPQQPDGGTTVRLVFPSQTHDVVDEG